ncbi:CHRD domain-containing protein [Bogoriella caseilytica]|uniref:CHRD domain-containing protein n=1 Tax=Bogoriella caseilytica TaxID=56055 RepID=A0A3N2BBI3_9MICO|nr:CHRD domain-containing protein [Bogoriella caseilytica]ROR72607.1 hypothetical protein EDD31_0963 [Bogoriella caseilytica]
MSRNQTGRWTLLTAASAGALGLVFAGSSASAYSDGYNNSVDEPDYFTSAFTAMATPDAVVDGDGEPAPGEEGAMGEFTFRVNSDYDIICWHIELTGVTGDYESPAATATHIHDAAAGEAGPPRLAFPDPEPVGDGPRTSYGCMEGPFMTGLEDEDGNDHGEGFTLAELEADPAAFSADSHTENYPAGVVRGQLMQVPVGGLETGGGGTAEQSSMMLPLLGAGGLALAGVAGALTYRARRNAA